jgi:hypothetical protein
MAITMTIHGVTADTSLLQIASRLPGLERCAGHLKLLISYIDHGRRAHGDVEVVTESVPVGGRVPFWGPFGVAGLSSVWDYVRRVCLSQPESFLDSGPRNL